MIAAWSGRTGVGHCHSRRSAVVRRQKIPELAKGLGTGIKEFKKATREVTDEIQNAQTETPAKTRRPRRPRLREPTCRWRNPPLRPRPDGAAIAWPATQKRNIPTTAEGGPVKTFLEHLEDFRWMLIKSVVALFARDAGLPVRGQRRHRHHQVAVEARPDQFLRHQSDRRRQLRHESSRQFSAHAGSSSSRSTSARTVSSPSPSSRSCSARIRCSAGA